ncbi:MAG: hypothetical protein HQK96_01675 [Nitrospirae bacterium]|nr:hypothetical protein [Nitrospirota bacterium]
MNLSDVYKHLYAMSRDDLGALLDGLNSGSIRPENNDLLAMSSAIEWNTADFVNACKFVLSKKE